MMFYLEVDYLYKSNNQLFYIYYIHRFTAFYSSYSQLEFVGGGGLIILPWYFDNLGCYGGASFHSSKYQFLLKLNNLKETLDYMKLLFR